MMHDDYRMFDEGSDDGEPIDPDTALITAFLSRELTAVQVAAVERRIENDSALAKLFESISSAWSVLIPRWSAETNSVAPPTSDELEKGWQRFVGRDANVFAGVTKKNHRRKSRVRMAAMVAAVALPVAVSAQLGLFAGRQPTARSLTEEIRIVSNDSSLETMFASVNSVAAASDGMIFLADRGPGHIKVYDANGKYVRAFGRLGEGPGEFRPNLGMVIEGVVGDTVRVQDVTMRHIVVYLRNGTYLRTEPGAGADGQAVLRSYLGDGHSLVRNVYRPNAPPGPGPTPPGDSQAYLVVDASKRTIARLAVEPHRDRGTSSIRGLIRENGQSYSKSWSQPFIEEIYAARDPRGQRGLAIVPYARFGGNPGQVKLIIVTRTGIESERVVDLGARRLTTAMRDAWIKSEVDAIADEMRRGRLPSGIAGELLRNEIKMPPYLPVYEEARLGGDGSIWIKPYQSNDWVVYPPGRAASFRVRVPPGIRVEQVQVDKVWGQIWDSDGLPIVIRYRVGS